MERKNTHLSASQIREAYLRGQERGVKSEQSEALAHFFAIARIKAELTVEELAEKSGVELDDLVDFELRQLHKYQAAQVAEKLKDILEIDDDLYKKILLDRGKNATLNLWKLF